jgi:hypothetical protein
MDDNLGAWEHIAVGIKMVLVNGVGGMRFAGVGPSFSPSPSPSLLIIYLLTADVRETQNWNVSTLVCSGRILALVPRTCAYQHEAPRTVPS